MNVFLRLTCWWSGLRLVQCIFPIIVYVCRGHIGICKTLMSGLAPHTTARRQTLTVLGARCWVLAN